MSEPPPDSPPRTFSLEEVTPHMPGKAEDLMKRLGFHCPFLSAVEYRDALASTGLPPLRCAIEVASVAIKMKWPFCDIRKVVHDFPLNDYSHMLDEIAYTLDPAPRPDRLEILGKALSLCFLNASESSTPPPEMRQVVIDLIGSLSAALGATRSTGVPPGPPPAPPSPPAGDTTDPTQATA